MKRRTKVAIAAAGAVPLVLAGPSPAQAAPHSVTRTITIDGAECTFRGTSEVVRAQDATLISATTTLVEPAADGCSEGTGFWVTIRYRRAGRDFYESATASSKDGAEANLHLQLEEAPADLSVDHTVFYPCAFICWVEWQTHPK